jgi:YVTN family beta-propeller protein
MVLFLTSAVAAPAAPAVATSRPGHGQVEHDASASGFGSALVGSAPAGIGSTAVAFDAATRTIYVANGNNANGTAAGGNTVSVIDGRRCNARSAAKCKGPWPTVTVGNEPSTLTVDQATHTVYVTNIDDNTVSVINGATCNGRVVSGCGQTPATIPVGSAPFGVFADEANHTVYVSNFNEGTVSMIDSGACNGTHPGGCPTVPPPTVKVSDGPGDMDVNQATHTAYVATLTGLTAFDTNTCNANTQTGCGRVGTFTLCTTCFGPFSAKVDPANNTIYEGDGDTSIAAIDGNACNAGNLVGCETAPFGTITLPNPIFGDHTIALVVDAALHSVYVVLQKDDLVVVIDTNVCNGANLSACAALSPPGIHTGADPESISLDPRTQTLYVANQVDNTVSVIDASQCNTKVTLGCRHRPPNAAVSEAGGVAVDESAHTAYVTSGPDAVAMIDTRTCNAFDAEGCRQPPPTVAVGDDPQAIAINHLTDTAYVANHGAGSSGSVSVLDTRTCNAHPSGCATTATLDVLAGNPTAIAVNTVTDTIYVATATTTGSNVVSVFNGATCNAATTTGCTQSPALMTIGPANGCSRVIVFVAVNEATDTIYATNTDKCNGQGDKVYVYNGATCNAANTTGCGNPVATVSAGSNPYGIAVDQATNTVYAPLLADGEHAGSVAVINGATCNGTNTTGCGQTPTITPAGFGSGRAAVDPTTHNVYVTNDEDMSVTVIDGKHCNGTVPDHCNQPTGKVAVDDYPIWIAVDPADGSAYATSDTRGTVSALPLKQHDDEIDDEVPDRTPPAEASTVEGNLAIHNGGFGIAAVVGAIDGGGNRAAANGNPLQCLNIDCHDAEDTD